MKPTKAIRSGLLAMLVLVVASANATFHLWRMTEIYSNADGSVQFLELAVETNGEEFITNHTLTSESRGAPTRTYTFLTNPGTDTFGKTMLIATEGFAALGLVTPDYVVPNGFFSAGGGSVNFADVDIWDYPALPSGILSLPRTGPPSPATPKNFAGRTATLAEAPPATLNVQALWWRGAPAGSESGWGLNITHQGDILFATWFTYDLDGTAMWLVAPDTRRTTGNAFTGLLYRTRGPAFSSTPFDSTVVAATQVGSVTLSFTGSDAGTFAYTVNGVTQSKAITRQVFDVAVSTCAANGAVGAANYQDLWWRSSESGWGVNLTHQGDIVFATWFTYDATGKGMWVVMPAGRLSAPGVYSGRLYRTTGPAFNAVPFTPATVAITDVGVGTFTFSSSGAGTFAYTVNGITQSKAIARQVYSTPATVCR